MECITQRLLHSSTRNGNNANNLTCKFYLINLNIITTVYNRVHSLAVEFMCKINPVRPPSTTNHFQRQTRTIDCIVTSRPPSALAQMYIQSSYLIGSVEDRRQPWFIPVACLQLIYHVRADCFTHESSLPACSCVHALVRHLSRAASLVRPRAQLPRAGCRLTRAPLVVSVSADHTNVWL